MPLSDLAGFVGFALFFLAWFWIHGRAAFRTGEFLASDLGRQMYRNMSHREAKLLASVFLVAGIIFVGFAARQLYHGTFRWRGSDREYGFRDLLP
jgi:hypothetical protein